MTDFVARQINIFRAVLEETKLILFHWTKNEVFH